MATWRAYYGDGSSEEFRASSRRNANNKALALKGEFPRSVSLVSGKRSSGNHQPRHRYGYSRW